MNPPSADALNLPPDTTAIELATQWLDNLARRERWNGRLKFALMLSVDEALTNILMHGFSANAASEDALGERYIRLEHTSQNNLVEILVADNGVAFDPTSIASPDVAASVETAKIGGHGVQLMRHYLRQLLYSRVEGENQLRLVAELATD